MSIDIRLPNITAPTDSGKLQQVQSYLFQLAEQLNWALKTVEAGTAGSNVAMNTSGSSSGAVQEKEAEATFNSIKALIIKSADIVNAYCDQISVMLAGMYVAQSDFGTYTEAMAQQIKANADRIEQNYSNVQQIIADIDALEHTLIDVSAYIKSGLLYYDEDGVPVYGLEIGQKTEIDEVEVFHKYARFTAEKLSFYDSNGNEVAYISDKKLYITHIEVTGSFTIGGLVDTVLPDGSVVTR